MTCPQCKAALDYNEAASFRDARCANCRRAEMRRIHPETWAQIIARAYEAERSMFWWQYVHGARRGRDDDACILGHMAAEK